MVAQSTDLTRWLEMTERLRTCPGWPDDDSPIETVQTHISVVLLCRGHVLKLKKPVGFGFLDYTTLEKRLNACRAELELNRRLCPDAYLDVLPICSVNGQLRIGGPGEIVDYGVLMKRLPHDRMLDHLVASAGVTEAMIDRVADRLSTFHKQAKRSPEIDRYGGIDVIRLNWQENFNQTAAYQGRTISPNTFDAIQSYVFQWIANNESLIGERVRNGRICDGHGDVRCESICVTDGICIFDCIEFNERFRYGDVASEAAFLAMDLDARGRPDLGYYFAERYQVRTDDTQLFALLPFYRCYRAYVRGKVLSFRLDDPGFDGVQRDSAITRAKHYFNLARRYADRLQQPAVIIVGGLSGTGKTSMARAVAGELGLRVVSSDIVRKALFGSTEVPAGYGQGLYDARSNKATYEALIEAGRRLLSTDGGVVLDATFRRAADRSATRAMAESAGGRLLMIECRLDPAEVRRRLEHRASLREGASDATWETYIRQRAEFETADAQAHNHLILDTRRDLVIAAHEASDWIRQQLKEPG